MDAVHVFFNLVRPDVCHDTLEFGPGPSLCCKTCQTTPIPDLYAYICDKGDEPLTSCRLAQAYFEMTRDERTPVSFTLVAGDGILTKRIKGQLLCRLRESVELLKAVNAPFLENRDAVASPPPAELTKRFLSRYLESVTSQKCQEEHLAHSEKLLLHNLVKNMHQVLHCKETPNPFDYYFERLVPFVKRCHPQGLSLEEKVKTTTIPNLAHELIYELERSQRIRDCYSRYSIPFDVIHVMLGCYVSSADLHAVANWALDLMARVCSGYFFWKRFPSCDFVRNMQTCLASHVQLRKNPKLYYVKREIEKGNAAESLSTFLPQYAQLEQLVKDKFRVPDTSEEILQIAIQQFFPAVLFQENADQLGFTMALGHVACQMDMKTGFVKKGAYSAARKIDNVIRKYAHYVKAFNEIQNCWTIDTLHQFLESAPELERDIVTLSKLVLLKEEEQEVNTTDAEPDNITVEINATDAEPVNITDESSNVEAMEL